MTVIALRPLPSSPWLTHDPGFGTSTVTLPAPSEVVEVRLNGVALRHRVIDPLTVIVSPMVPMQGDRLDVLLEAPEEPSKALQWPTPAYPPPAPSYGLTAQQHRPTR